MTNDTMSAVEIGNGSDSQRPGGCGFPDAKNISPAEKLEAQKRCLFTYHVLVGYTVRIKLKDGRVLEGIFSSMDSEKVTMKMVKQVDPTTGTARRTVRPQPSMTIATDDWEEIESVEVSMRPEDVGAVGQIRRQRVRQPPSVTSVRRRMYMADESDADTDEMYNGNVHNAEYGTEETEETEESYEDALETDTAISGGWGGATERVLERWTPDVPQDRSESDTRFMGLEDSMPRSGGRNWDQFAVNEQRFGVKTDYAEEMYTTVFDPSKSKITLEEAERLAAEIEKEGKLPLKGQSGYGNAANIHVLEERGIEIDDGEVDEEDRYGAVLRAQGSTSTRPLSTPLASTPITIDPRRETNKVRAAMTGSSKATSPFGTPKQLSSPLVGDAQRLAALNLDPGVAKVDNSIRQEFEEFKARQAAQGHKGEGSISSNGGGGGGGGSGPIELSKLKQFSDQVASKLQLKSAQSRTPEPDHNQNHVRKEGKQHVEKKDSEKSNKEADEKEKKGSTLNPNAKSFTLNINAKEFTPSFSSGGTGKPSPPAQAPPPKRHGDQGDRQYGASSTGRAHAMSSPQPAPQGQYHMHALPYPSNPQGQGPGRSQYGSNRRYQYQDGGGNMYYGQGATRAVPVMDSAMPPSSMSRQQQHQQHGGMMPILVSAPQMGMAMGIPPGGGRPPASHPGGYTLPGQGPGYGAPFIPGGGHGATHHHPQQQPPPQMVSMGMSRVGQPVYPVYAGMPMPGYPPLPPNAQGGDGAS